METQHQPRAHVLVVDDDIEVAQSLGRKLAYVGYTVEVERGPSRLPLERTAASAALRDEYAVCARAAGLGDGEAALLGGGSDANTVAPLGVPAIDGLGPRGAGFHTTAEHVELASFVPKAEALLRFLWGRRAPRQ